MYNFKLVFDTLRRLSISQIYFIIYNKLIKKNLNYLYVSFTKLLSKKPPLIEFPSFKRKIVEVIEVENLWLIGINSKIEFHVDYYNELKETIKEYDNSLNLKPLLKCWDEELTDIEKNYNYQRFYLFNEVFNELNISGKKRKDIILAWIDNSDNQKLGWTGFNCAIRLINWIKIFHDINYEEISQNHLKIIEDSIFLQHKFNRKNIEHHIPGNHILLQYYSAWLISVIFQRWFADNERDKILSLLIQEYENEYLDSGLHFELSTHYHLQLTLVGFYLLIHLRNINNKLPKKLVNIVSRAYHFINDIMVGKYYPLIGDGCYGFFHETIDEDLQNLQALNEKLKLQTSESNKSVNYSNYSSIYHVTRNNNFTVIFDTGNIGYGNNPGHGHSDTLSINVGYNEIPIFIDPGTRRYSNNKHDLELKRSSSHNTIKVENSDQALSWGFFRWAYLPQIIESSQFENLDEKVVIKGSFKTHRKIGGLLFERILSLSTNELLIEDEISGKIGKFVEINFILHPEVLVEKKQSNVILSTKSNKFVLQNNSDMQNSINVQNQLVYDNYDSPKNSNKIIFRYNEKINENFNSKISLKILE